MWFVYVIILILFIIVVWKIVKMIKNKPLPPPTNEDGETLYYRVTDVYGHQSIIHDSGIKHSLLGKCSDVFFTVLKNEYNDGKITNLSLPKKIELGYNPKKLYNILFETIKEEKSHFTIGVKYLCN